VKCAYDPYEIILSTIKTSDFSHWRGVSKKEEGSMKLLRNIAIGVSLLGLVVLAPKASFADQEHTKGNHESLIKLVNDAAAVLKQSRPDLAEALIKYSDQERKEEQAKKEGKLEKETKEDQGAINKLFRDSAAVLQQSNPDLAAGLLKSVEKRENKLTQMKEEKKEKEEVGEKVEPRSEQGETKK